MVKYKIAIIGAGKVAHSLAPALIQSGYDVRIVISRKLSSAKTLVRKFSIPQYSNSLKKIPEDVNVFFLTVPDGEIKKTADALSRIRKIFNDSLCIHFSGVENIAALKSLQKKGCSTGSLHLIRPFPSKHIVDIRNSPASIETENKQVKSFLLQLCGKLKLKSHTINSEEKVFHHIAAVHSSNFLVGNLCNAFSLISSKSKYPQSILKKTTQSALDNVFKLSPAKALSGPIDRGDDCTIKKHIEALDNKIRQEKNKGQLKLLRRNYIIQSLGLLEVAKVKYGKLNSNHLKIKKFLTEKLGKSGIYLK